MSQRTQTGVPVLVVSYRKVGDLFEVSKHEAKLRDSNPFGTLLDPFHVRLRQPTGRVFAAKPVSIAKRFPLKSDVTKKHIEDGIDFEVETSSIQLLNCYIRYLLCCSEKLSWWKETTCCLEILFLQMNKRMVDVFLRSLQKDFNLETSTSLSSKYIKQDWSEHIGTFYGSRDFAICLLERMNDSALKPRKQPWDQQSRPSKRTNLWNKDMKQEQDTTWQPN